MLSASCAPHVLAPRQPKPPSQFHNFAHFQCFMHISFKITFSKHFGIFCVMELLWFTCGLSRQYYMTPFPPYLCTPCLYKFLFSVSRQDKYLYFFWWKYISGYLSCIVPKCFLLPPSTFVTNIYTSETQCQCIDPGDNRLSYLMCLINFSVLSVFAYTWNFQLLISLLSLILSNLNFISL